MAYNGLAVYTTNIFDGLAEDVSDIVGIISPAETPLLDVLGNAPNAAENILHEWLEDSLAPTTLVASAAVASTTADTAIGVALGAAPRMRVGAIVMNVASGEYMQIGAISGNTITFVRAFGATSATSYGVLSQFQVISDAAQEGADVDRDTSIGRLRKTNYVQMFKKDVIVSGTKMATTNLGGIGNEFDYQKTLRLREMVRDLERAVILSILSGNTIGSSTATRTMKGLRSALATNANSVGTSLTSSWIDNSVKSAWTNGGTDLNVIVCDNLYKQQIDQLNTARVRTVNEENKFRNMTTTYEGTYGVQQVVMSRWMLPTTAFVLARNRVSVMPLKGRTFQFLPVARTGDAEKGYIVGEYTMEFKNEEGMAKISAS